MPGVRTPGSKKAVEKANQRWNNKCLEQGRHDKLKPPESVRKSMANDPEARDKWIKRLLAAKKMREERLASSSSPSVKAKRGVVKKRENAGSDRLLRDKADVSYEDGLEESPEEESDEDEDEEDDEEYATTDNDDNEEEGEDEKEKEEKEEDGERTIVVATPPSKQSTSADDNLINLPIHPHSDLLPTSIVSTPPRKPITKNPTSTSKPRPSAKKQSKHPQPSPFRSMGPAELAAEFVKRDQTFRDEVVRRFMAKVSGSSNYSSVELRTNDGYPGCESNRYADGLASQHGEGRMG